MTPVSQMTGMQKWNAVIAVYLSGFLQGIALIMFPAAGPLLTSTEFHNLSSGQFGFLFTPQIITAIIASTLTARCAQWFGGMRNVLRAGLAANILAMLLLAASHLVTGMESNIAAYSLLLLATGAVGAGFGFAISALNAYAFDLFQDKADAAVTGLHVLTGAGQVGASLILSAFVGLGFWWGAPGVVAVALAAMIVFQLTLSMRLSEENMPAVEGQSEQLPNRIWLYAAIAFLYGTCEGTFGNWSPIYLETDAGLGMEEAGLALSVFWGMVTAGRVLFALISLRVKPQAFYMAAPWIVAGSFFVLPLLSGFLPNMIVLGLAGLGMSFFFPLTVSIASAEAPHLASKVSGTMVAAIMLGIGFSANAVGFLTDAFGLSLIFQLSSLYALVMGGLAVYLTITRKTTSAIQEATA